MTRPTTPFGQPSLEELTARLLAHGSDNVESGEMTPYRVDAGFRADPRAAWTDATTHTPAPTGSPPPDWAALVAQAAPAAAVPCAAGNFPQRVSDLHPLLARFHPAELRPHPDQVPMHGFAGLRGWVAKNAAAHPVLAAGVARLLGDFDQAETLLPADAANERAALLWQRGRCAEALAAWEAAADTPAVLFNRGMARLFAGRPADAVAPLTAAAAALPQAGGWANLARLYLAVAEVHV
ncbi:MAG: hypothetical protein C0501_19650 [Isosphaera sp.]|nr:hypothetical protein [Isosphaera sp.]